MSDSTPQSVSAPNRSNPIRARDLSLDYLPSFLTNAASTQLFQHLLERVSWQTGTIKLFGREVRIPRLQAWYADPGLTYRYSGVSLQPEPWLPELLRLKQQLESHLGTHFNSVLLNLYRDGNDSMGWHRDNEPELGTMPTIASVSLGASRRFSLRHRDRRNNGEPICSLSLSSGSVLVMKGKTQDCWEHSLPKNRSQGGVGPRINLTYRRIID